MDVQRQIGDGCCGCDRHLVRSVRRQRSIDRQLPVQRRIRGESAQAFAGRSRSATNCVLLPVVDRVQNRFRSSRLLAVAQLASRGSVGDGTDSALVLDGHNYDGFISHLLPSTPFRLGFNVTVGYSSARGLVLEGSVGGSAAPAPPLAGSGNVGTPIIAATIPIGRGLGPLTIHEVGFRLLRGPADVPPAQMQQITLELNTSFSALIGPVYIRLDQLGIAFTLDQGKPPEQRNLRLIDLHPGL